MVVRGGFDGSVTDGAAPDGGAELGVTAIKEFGDIDAGAEPAALAQPTKTTTNNTESTILDT
jgi:hypothetical protein